MNHAQVIVNHDHHDNDESDMHDFKGLIERVSHKRVGLNSNSNGRNEPLKLSSAHAWLIG